MLNCFGMDVILYFTSIIWLQYLLVGSATGNELSCSRSLDIQMGNMTKEIIGLSCICVGTGQGGTISMLGTKS